VRNTRKMSSDINTRRTFLVAIIFCILSLSLPGQKPAGQETFSDTLEIYPATVIAIRPHAARSESLELDYQDRMAHDAGALLSQIASIGSIKKSGGYGFDPVFRGFKYEQLNLVLDGAQTASAACPNRMDPPTSQMAPNMIRKIEILKGPYALRFGNSFGGTINFITAQPSYSEKKEGYGRISGRYDSNGNILRTEGLAGFRSRRTNLGLYAAWSQGEDYRSGGDQIIPAGFLRASFGARLGIQVSRIQHLTLSVTRNLARDSDFASLPMDLRADNTWMFSASHELYPSAGPLKSWHTTLYGSLVDHLMDNLLKPLDPRTMNASTRANTANYGMRSEGAWGFQRSRLYTGLDFRYEGAEGLRTREFLMGPNAGTELTDNVWQGGQIQHAGIFAEYQLQGRQLRWVWSGRLNLNHAGITDPDPDFVNLYPVNQSTQLNPAVSLGITNSLPEKISLGLWLGRVQRSGSLTERYINYFPVGLDPYEMLGNPMLDPEINYETDLSIQYRSDRSSFHLDLFAAYLRDLISSLIDTSLTPRLPNSPGVRQYTNIDRAFKTGFEFSWEQKWPAGLQHQLSIAYTYGKDLQRDDPLPEIAPLDMRFHLSGSYLSNRLKPYLMVRHAMKQDRISKEFGETTTPSFTLVDLGLSFRFTPSVSSTAGIQNLFDALYYEHLSRSVRGMDETPIYAPGRCFFLSVSLNFM
jgi:iron complex outermembrane recepter protein